MRLSKLPPRVHPGRSRLSAFRWLTRRLDEALAAFALALQDLSADDQSLNHLALCDSLTNIAAYVSVDRPPNLEFNDKEDLHLCTLTHSLLSSALADLARHPLHTTAEMAHHILTQHRSHITEALERADREAAQAARLSWQTFVVDSLAAGASRLHT